MVILGLVISGIGVYLASPVQDIHGLLREGEYEEIAKIYNEEIKNKFMYEELADAILIREINEIRNKLVSLEKEGNEEKVLEAAKNLEKLQQIKNEKIQNKVEESVEGFKLEEEEPEQKTETAEGERNEREEEKLKLVKVKFETMR